MAPQVQRAAAIRVEENEIRKLLDVQGNFAEIVDPYTELANLANEVVGLKNVLRAKVEELTSLKDYGGEKVLTQIDVVVSAYERALDRSERLLLGISRLDLDGKIAALQARVDQETGELVSRALRTALSAASLPPDQTEQIMRSFGAALRGPEAPAIPATTHSPR